MGLELELNTLRGKLGFLEDELARATQNIHDLRSQIQAATGVAHMLDKNILTLQGEMKNLRTEMSAEFRQALDELKLQTADSKAKSLMRVATFGASLLLVLFEAIKLLKGMH